MLRVPKVTSYLIEITLSKLTFTFEIKLTNKRIYFRARIYDLHVPKEAHNHQNCRWLSFSQ